jgi:ribosomal protein S18 acetylase RimI-like enzyme
VLVAVDDDGTLLGGVTYVGDPSNGWAEFEAEDEAGFRMLAVAPAARGRGAGRALVEACIERARRDGKSRLSLLTTANMESAHRLYERLGFRRSPESDMIVEDGLRLRSYVFDLAERGVTDP